jgi:hypothetical protein
MNKIVYVADSMYPEFIGGGELNDCELCEILKENSNVEKIKSSNVTIDFLSKNKNCFFILSNFLLLNKDCYNFILNNLKYVIYEHDHKYLRSRNPAQYVNYQAPQSEIVNKQFYINAVAVLCQSSFHKNIIEKNIGLKNVVNLSGNLWSTATLDILEKNSSKSKQNLVSIMESKTWHKNTSDAISYCAAKKLNYELIHAAPYEKFLNNLSNNSKLLFLPKTPETLSRICVEARMMGMSVITNKNVGASYEDWFSLKGKEMIDFMKNKRIEISQVIKDLINEK